MTLHEYFVVSPTSTIRLSQNFGAQEFRCKGTNCCQGALNFIHKDLVKFLQVLRNHVNRPVWIHSAYRCRTHNTFIKGAAKSKHCVGDACDISVAGITPIELKELIRKLGHKGGVGLYAWGCHIDVGPERDFTG